MNFRRPQLTLPMSAPQTANNPAAVAPRIAGPLSATLSIRCSLLSASQIVSQMLRVSVEEAAALKCDAVGEICNIVAGSFKAKIGLGEQCKLSLPTVLVGKNYQIRSPGKDHRIELSLIYLKEPIWIALDIRP